MSHTKKKRCVPDKASGTQLRSVCGILCGQRKSRKSHSTKKLRKAKENTRNPKISGVFLELLSGFEPETSSLPSVPGILFVLLFVHVFSKTAYFLQTIICK